jgi:hypothetical protein
MSIKNCVFDSYHEKDLYKHLKSVWKTHFNLYPQLPFTKIFDINKLKVNYREKDFLLKTNVDITICDKKDRPLMCIEFDGLSHGYSKGGEYIQILEDLERKKKLELKLSIALNYRFPFYIISYDEKDYISESYHLMVIDGIVGQTIANLGLKGKVEEYLDRYDLSKMSAEEKHDFIQDLVLDAETELELTWDPIAQKVAKLAYILYHKGILKSYGFEYLTKPELPEIKDIYDIEGLTKRTNAWKFIEWHGCKVSCITSRGIVTDTAWVRNFEGISASPIVIVENIAQLRAFYKVASLHNVNI